MEIKTMSKSIRIYRDGVWAGDGRLDPDGEIVDCPAVLGLDQDASDQAYEAIQDAIAEDDDGGWKGSVQREDSVYSWEIWDDTPRYTIQMVDENGVERDDTCGDLPSPEQVKDAAEVQWHRMPRYMPQGAFLTIHYSILDAELDLLSTGSVGIDVEPDHTHLIGEACERRGCGVYHDMHEWHTIQREVDSECRRCGLRKTWHLIGGHRAVTYEMPSRNED